MSTVNDTQNNAPDLISIEALIAANLAEQLKNAENKADPKAGLAQLSQTIEEVLQQLTPTNSKNPDSKVVHVNFKAPANGGTSNGAPTNAEMQKMMGELMGMLTELEGKIAEYGNKNANMNSAVGKDLIKEMQAEVKKANDELKKIIEEEKQSSFWSIFTKVVEGVVGVLLTGIALLCGQPELAAIALVFTVLSLSGGMNKITQGLSDVISQALIQMGVSKR